MEMSIHSLFERQLRLTPDYIAVSFGERILTYADLDREASRLSQAIIARSPNSAAIGISTMRRIEMVIGVLAILRSGKAYLPLDPSYPADRLQQIVSDSGIDTCLSMSTEEEATLASLQGLSPLSFNATTAAVDLTAIQNREPFLAYLLYTSGSTGKSKGVCMGHAPLVNLLQWQQKHSIAAAGTRTLQFAPLTFDVSFQELFATLTTGGTLVLIEDELRLDPQKLLRFIGSEGINRIFLPFVALQYITEAADNAKLFPSSLQEVMTAGEQLKITPQVVNFFSALPGAVLYNQYGPTETHVVTELVLQGDPNAWPALPNIGKPIDNTGAWILDPQQRLLPDGDIGELCFSGVCLSEGYLHRPELTAQKYLHWTHPEKGQLRLYRTGDLARYLPDGNIEFLGRMDDQVKIRGYRIELGEIEVVLNQASDVQQSVVIAREDVPGTKRLVAYMVSSSGKKDTQALRQLLARTLPDYMMPAAFVWLDELPHTTSGKIDKRALPKPEIKRPELTVLYKAPATKTETLLAGLWAGLLQLDKVGSEDNFFELGGNSLVALKTVAVLQQEHGLDLPITKLYQFPTVKTVAAWLDGGKKARIQLPKDHGRRTTGAGNDDIAIIGMAGRFPGAATIDELWTILKTGKETVSFFSKEELDAAIPASLRNDPDYVPVRGIIDGADTFDAGFFGISPRLAELMDPQQRIFLEIAWEALEKTGYLPEKYSGSIGVFAGSGNNSYYLNNVIPNKELVDRVGSFQVMTYNEKDYVASRTAYVLNLKGPAVSVHSGCSTSLLAVAQAMDSLRKGQCDIALAGGASVTAPIRSGHIYQDGAMLSRDGHCRPFDAEAQGTTFSDGAGIVLLKRREQAEKDGDTIYAVLKGAGINNDGSGKGSFTAPSAEGQAGAIAMAIAEAGFEASSISYVEAHGTATPLGDPIEIEGLRMAFGDQSKKQYCAIGSIKSNMGHLTAAAGVAGLIKTTLALWHRQLPPSINYNSANPAIDFGQTPFFVNTALRDWQANGLRRAGVSSFGVGGTNVHVVVEEAPQPAPAGSPAGRPVQLVTWSARTPQSREAYGNRLAACAATATPGSLADIAFTLQSTRAEFAARRFVLATDEKDLVRQLRQPAPAPSTTGILEESRTDIVFLFPGQGSQQVNMGLQLYEHEAVFRQAVDECAQLLLPVMGEDIRGILYPRQNTPDTAARINNTLYAQPALFVIEYALSCLWKSWGIVPAAFAGHSIGEFVAAHLAGVFSLKDGLHLIATRGRMMSEQPGGSMLSIRAPHEKIAPLLPGTLSMAAVNSPELCVVSGPTAEITTFSALLESQGIQNKPLYTSHAFHSAMMDAVVEPFRQLVASIPLSLPRLPIASTATGKWLTDTEATSPAYWAAHLRETVRFSGAVTTLLENDNRLMLEVGPGKVTAVLVRQHRTAKPATAISSLDAEEGASQYHAVLKALGQLWLNGIQPNWNAFYAGQQRRRLELPAYAFDRQPAWVNPPQPPAPQAQPSPLQPQPHTSMSFPITENLTQNRPMRTTELIRKVKEILEDASGIELQAADPDTSFVELGLDSLLLTQVALNLKKSFNLPISFRQLNEEYGSLNLLVTYLDANLPPDPVQVQSQQLPQAQLQAQPQTYAQHQPAYAQQPMAYAQQPIAYAQQSAIPAGGNNATVIALISQQIQLLAQQIALLQGGIPMPVYQQAAPVVAIPQAMAAPAFIPAPSANGNGKPKMEGDLTAEELVEHKKPFGATAKIDKNARELDVRQQAFLNDLVARYTAKTATSKRYTAEHRSYMADPRVVTGFKPQTKEIVYPIVVNRSKGSRLWDLDGNEYIDALNGFGSNMLGYQPGIIVNAIHEQMEKGYEIGPQHELAGPVSKLICEFTGFDRAALCNTGSEAVLGAMRIARTVTGRSTIVAFAGSYHGIVDEVIVRGSKKLKSFPAAPGIMPEAVQNMLILDYGTEESLRIIKERAHELAAVLVEPVQSRRPEFQPVEFLKKLRTITEDAGTCLIFDEVITGFRMHPGGAQALFGVKADLGTYGKVIGSGISIGVIAGRKLYMNALDGGDWKYGDNSTPEAGVTYFAGTFVRHPLALAASKASLEYMKAKGPALQQLLTDNTKYLADSFNAISKRHELPLYVAQFGSLWKIKWKEEITYGELLFTLMRDKGIHILDGFPCFLTEAHSRKDIDTIIEKFEQSVDQLIDAGFLQSINANPTVLNKNPEIKVDETPLIPGARLGRDQDGNPAWFINDPDRPGKYLQVN
ncbi:amino acid adenylation domain-containing protein [Puia sp.]|uniref:amino acid adenylation domain-containing protein n=1 Tax=Puia sp. TaxID=2045100 RepID=UPI002F3EB73D